MLATQAELGYSFPETLLALAEKNPDVVVVSPDPDHGTRAFASAFPSRYYQVSPADANLIEFAAGLAARRLRPIVIGLSWSQAEICCGNLASLILIGFDSFRDVSVMRVIPGMTVVIPCDNRELRHVLEAALLQSGPIYIRIPASTGSLRCNEPPPEIRIGKTRKLRDGFHLTIAVCGAVTAVAMEAANRLAQEGIAAELLEIPTIKPMDIDTLVRSARKTRAVLTVEEHSVSGGLGSAVAETLCRFFPTGMQMIAAEDGPATVENVAQKARVMAMMADCA
jgi:transketolase